MNPELIKKYGNVFFSASQIKDSKLNIIPVGPVLDLGLHGGIQEGTWTIVSGMPKIGKGQPLDSIIYTPEGPIRMGDIKIGQSICSPDGTITNVVGIFPQGKKKVYRIYFTNGRKVECDEDHLWLIKDHSRKDEEVISLKDLLKRTLYRYSNKYKHYEISIPTSICEFKESDLIIPPYIMGILLGDGSFRDSSLKITSVDKFILDEISNIISKDDFILKHHSNITYFIHDSKMTSWKTPNRYKKYIREIGLDNKLSYDKFIPTEYIYNSIENRLALIQGLLDTDGSVSINKKGYATIEYSTSSIQLANQVKYIIESLGGIASVKERFTFYTYKGKKLRGKKSYRVRISYKDQEKLFRLPRKKDLIPNKIKPVTNKIEKIEYIGEIETQCIKVDNINGLYVTNDFITTHNTTLVLQIAKNAQKLYDKKIFITDAEGRFGELQTGSVTGLDLDKVTVIKSEPGNILSAQKHLDIGLNIIKDNPGCIYIIDSTSALCAEEELAAEIKSAGRNNTPKLLASFCRQAGQIVPINKVTVILIQHLIANTSGYGSPYIEDSGQKVKYQFQNKLKAKSVEKWLNKEDKQIGQIIKWAIEGSALGPPGETVQSYIRYGYGIDEVMEIIDLALLTGIIKKGGAWFSSECFDSKIQGQEKLHEYLSSEPGIYQNIYTKVKELL